MRCLLMQISYSELVKYYKKGEPKLSLWSQRFIESLF